MPPEGKGRGSGDIGNSDMQSSRPWTPNSGSDVLLTRPGMSVGQMSPARLYQKRGGKLQKLGVSTSKSFVMDADGHALAPVHADPLECGLSWATSSVSGQDQRPSSIDISSPGAEGDRKLHGSNIHLVSPVFIKNHTLGKMSLYPAKEHFSSHALTLETELKEFFSSPLVLAHEDGLTPDGAALCISLLESIAERPGAYQKVLIMLKNYISRFMFARIPRSGAASPSPSEEHFEVPYIEVCRQLKKEVKRLEVELEMSSIQMTRISNKDGAGGGGDMKRRLSINSGIHGGLYGEIKAKEDLIERLEKETGDLKKVVRDQTSKINSLQRELEDQARRMEEAENVSTQLKGAFLRNKKDLMEARTELEHAKEDYQAMFVRMQSMVPRAEYEAIKAEKEMYQGSFLQRQSEQDELAENPEEVFQTPRPNWKKLISPEMQQASSVQVRRDSTQIIAQKLVRSVHRLNEANMTLKLQLSVLDVQDQEEAAANEDAGKINSKYIQCLGTGPDVPKYLRFNGQVRNRRMAKRDAEKAIREMWNLKLLNDQSKGPVGRQPMSDFFYEFCRKKFGAFQNLIAEWSYNLIAVLEQNSHDVDCDLFLKVLRGQLSEDVYYDQLKQIEECKDLAVECDKMLHSGAVLGKAGKNEFHNMIRVKFNKNWQQMAELKQALDAVYGEKSNIFKYERLFAEDRDYSQNEFAEEFKSQMIKEREEHIRMIKGLVQSLTGEDGQMYVPRFRLALKRLDKDKRDMDVEAYIRRGCGGVADLPETEDADTFMANLMKGVCKPGPLQ